MKHSLTSPFGRSPWLRVTCILILAFMCAPLAMAAASAPVAAPAAKGVGGLAALAIGAPFLMLRSAAGDDGQENGGGSVDPAAAIAAIEDKTLPMSQRLGVALKALQGIPPAEQFTQVKTDLATAQSALLAKDTEISDLKAKLGTIEAQLAAAQGDVTTLEQSNAKLEKENKDLAAKEADLDKRAEAKAKEKMATLGFPASRLPASSEQMEQASSADLWAAAEKESDPVKKGKLAAQAMALDTAARRAREAADSAA